MPSANTESDRAVCSRGNALTLYAAKHYFLISILLYIFLVSFQDKHLKMIHLKISRIYLKSKSFVKILRENTQVFHTK